jgi:hypothetical protein
MDANDFLKSIAQQVAPQAQTRPSGSASASAFGSGPKLQFSIPCFEVDYESHRAPSLKYIFFDLPLPGLPQRLSFYVVNGWIGGTKQAHQMIKILRPDGTVHLETPKQPLEFVDVNTPFLAVNSFPKIPFDVEGLFFIVVHLEDQEVLRYPLTVRLVEGRPEEEEPAVQQQQDPYAFGGGGSGYGHATGLGHGGTGSAPGFHGT